MKARTAIVLVVIVLAFAAPLATPSVGAEEPAGNYCVGVTWWDMPPVHVNPEGCSIPPGG